MRMRNGRPASATSTSPFCMDVGDMLLEQAGDMRGIGRRRDGRDRARLRHLLRRGQHGGAAEAVADQDRGRPEHLAQVIRGRDQVGDVGGERRVGELALARAEPGEIEAQHRDAARRQAFGDALCRQHVLAAGEAMREQRERDAAVRPGGRAARRAFRRAHSGNSKRSDGIASSLVSWRVRLCAAGAGCSGCAAGAPGSALSGGKRMGLRYWRQIARSRWNSRRSRCAGRPAARSRSSRHPRAACRNRPRRAR